MRRNGFCAGTHAFEQEHERKAQKTCQTEEVEIFNKRPRSGLIEHGVVYEMVRLQLDLHRVAQWEPIHHFQIQSPAKLLP